MEKLRLDDFQHYKFLSGLRFATEGKNSAFVLSSMNIEDNKYTSNIYIMDKDKKTRQLTGLDEESSFIWKDDQTILFPAIREKKDKDRKEKGQPLTVFYEININGGEGLRSIELPFNGVNLKILDNEKFIFTAQVIEEMDGYYEKSQEEKDKLLEELEESKAYEILDEIPFWSNGGGYTNKSRNRLYIYDKKENQFQSITDIFTDVGHFALNKDKSKVAIITSSYMDKMNINNELYLYDIEKDLLEKISPIDDFSYSFCDFMDNNIIFVGSKGEDYGLNENPHIYISSLNGENYNRLTDEYFDFSLYNSVNSDCRYGGSRGALVSGEYIYFTTTEGHNSYINKIDIDGNRERLTSDNGTIDGFDVFEDKIYFIGQRGLNLQEIHELSSNGEVEITDFNSWLKENRSPISPELLKVNTETQIHGWVLKPIDFKEDKKYPAILNIHGGPKTAFGDIYNHEMQYWANKGYFVFYCNPRGSDGKGNEFADIRGKYGSIDYEDLKEFTRKVLEKYPQIDQERLGVTGGSYGGFMTNWIIGHTNMFKAAASQRSISNWFSFFGNSDIGYYFTDDQIDTNPWKDYEKIWDSSPMKYADKVTTPTLFIHSDEDYRCWYPEALQMFTALKYHGVESRLCSFKGENHELSRSGKPKNRVKRLKEITDWFDKYLKQR